MMIRDRNNVLWHQEIPRVLNKNNTIEIPEQKKTTIGPRIKKTDKTKSSLNQLK